MRGFLWSMGRCGTKAIWDTINTCTTGEMPSWVDTVQFVESPDYFLQLYSRPFVLALHLPHHTHAYQTLLQDHPHLPVVMAVRDPLPNIKSYAKVFLTSYVSRRIDEVARTLACGGTIIGSINPAAIDQWLMPMIDYWRHWSIIEKSPHRIVDLTDLDEMRFGTTLTEITDLFRLDRTTPIAWTGIGNTEIDSFLLSYRRELPLLGRKIELYFTRWRNFWPEPGLVTLGTLRSPLLDPLIGPDEYLFVHARADKLLSWGGIEREREALGLILGHPELSQMIAAVVIEDHALVTGMVGNELDEFQNVLIAKFNASYRSGVERFLQAHPWLQERWSSVSLGKTTSRI
ncbi:MAG: hypothetical protein JO256_09285 [Alphaproteobacteria bacterium]|nr:hypothetical protein [Alphaproteobacteria bacterium]